MAAMVNPILLIEEEPVLRDITAFRLELLGYQVETRASAAEAQQWLAENLPTLIAVGQVADLDPIDLLDRISDDQRTSQIPVLLLSANSDLDAVGRAFNAGADEYVVTPYDPMVLEEKVLGLISAAQTAPQTS
mgnify:FL=1